MELHLKIIGCLFIGLALLHIIFPKYFHWKKELSSLSIMNRQMMYVHSFFIALIILLMGIFCLYCTDDIQHTNIGRQIAFGLFIFWGIRLLFQFLVYSPKLWLGKWFETIVHIFFSFLWAYFTAVFLLIYLEK